MVIGFVSRLTRPCEEFPYTLIPDKMTIFPERYDDCFDLNQWFTLQKLTLST